MKKKVLILLFLGWILWLGSYFFIRIELKGEKKIWIHLNEPYEEFGAQASFFGYNLKLQVEDNINTKQIGKYYVCYKTRNIFGIARYKKRIVVVSDDRIPELKLKGASYIVLKEGMEYQEPGYDAIDDIDGTITKNVKVIGKVNGNKVGTYQLKYQVIDSSQNQTIAKRTVRVIPKKFTYQSSYDNIDNTLHSWWSGNKKDNRRPSGGADINKLKKYDAYFIGEDIKKIYLTFDEGSNDTYINEILDVLKEKRVQATFFLCHNYILHNETILKRMVNDGHLVGNHTADHKRMPSLARKESVDEFRNQIEKSEKTFRKLTGHEMGKVYREPAGEWSFRSLKMISDMGYRSYFWSADHYDFAHTVSKEKTLDALLKRHHNGAIYLLHPKNKGNYEALGEFIDRMHALGYSFGLVDEIGN